MSDADTLEGQLADFVAAAQSSELSGFPKLLLITFGDTSDVERVRQRLPSTLATSSALQIAAVDRADKEGLMRTLNAFANANYQGRHGTTDGQ